MNGYGGNAAAPPNGGEASGIVIPAGPTNQPRVLVRSLQRDEVVFHLSGVDMAYANSLRRTMMADVPTICEWLCAWVAATASMEGERREAIGVAVRQPAGVSCHLPRPPSLSLLFLALEEKERCSRIGKPCISYDKAGQRAPPTEGEEKEARRWWWMLEVC